MSAPRGPRTLVLGGSDFKERELAGTRPDVAAVPVPSSDATFDYLPRLLDCLDRPRVVVATHWDDFERPLVNPPQATAALRDPAGGVPARRTPDLAAHARRRTGLPDAAAGLTRGPSDRG